MDSHAIRIRNFHTISLVCSVVFFFRCPPFTQLYKFLARASLRSTNGFRLRCVRHNSLDFPPMLLPQDQFHYSSTFFWSL